MYIFIYNIYIYLILVWSELAYYDNLCNFSTLGTVHILCQQPDGGGGLEMLTVADGGGGGFEPC
jgi:hypothetical protein